jgi:ABC-2 type transport system ATP-binding protein
MIKTANLTKKYSGKTVVENLNIEIREGEVVGILGPNGAGKTTTIRMIAGTLPPTSGQVLINGKNIFDGNEDQKVNIGYLPENNPLYENLTVEENLEFWSKIKQIPKNKKNEFIQYLTDLIGLKEVFFRPINELSKGYKQRVGLSQALLGDPGILLLDEPTEGLDPNQRKEIQSLVTGLGKERTVVICSHVLSEITKMCTRAIIINHGKVVADNSVGNLTTNFQGKQILTLIVSGKGVKEALLSLDGVKSVKEDGRDGEKETYTIAASHEMDLRPKVFELTKINNWQLYELKMEKVTLEDVFSQLTRD